MTDRRQTSGGEDPLTESLSRHSGSQSSENPLLNDNHDAESCYSYKTAATSPPDPLEREDRSEAVYHPLSICDELLQPLGLGHFQGYISPTPRESSAGIVQLLEHCMSRVASLKISYDNKHLEDNCIGNDMNGIICKMSQYKNKLLLQNECNCTDQKPEYCSIPCTNQYNYETGFQASSLYHLKQNGEEICSEDQKSRAKILDEVTRGKINFEYAQLNNKALSYLKDFTFELSAGDPAPAALSRPTFLPLPSTPTASPAAHSLPIAPQPWGAEQHSPGLWGCMAGGAALCPRPEAAAPDSAVTGSSHP